MGRWIRRDKYIECQRGRCYLKSFTYYWVFLFFCFLFFRAHPRHIEVPRLGVKLELQLLAYTTAYGNAGSLTHWAGPGIKPVSSWILVGFITTEPGQELQGYLILFYLFSVLAASQHMEFTGQGSDPSCSLNWWHSSGNARSFNPLHWAGDRTQISA